MKHYLIVKRAKEWHVVVQGRKCGVLCCEDRAPLVQTACRLAAATDGSIEVYDPQNKLEARFTFQAGSLTIEGQYSGELDFVPAKRLDIPGTAGRSVPSAA